MNLAGEPIGNGLWTETKRRKILDSRIGMTKDVIALVARLQRKPGFARASRPGERQQAKILLQKHPGDLLQLQIPAATIRTTSSVSQRARSLTASRFTRRPPGPRAGAAGAARRAAA